MSSCARWEQQELPNDTVNDLTNWY